MEMNNDIFTPDLPIPEPVEFEDAPIPAPVSYTHLDVYKRQGFRFPLHPCRVVLVRHLQQQVFGADRAIDSAGSVLYLQYPVCLLYTSRCV